MTSKPNYFEILEIGLDASAEEIRKAYLDKARKFHPDALRNGAAINAGASDERMKAINLAYEVLRDAEKRQAYQRSLHGSSVAPAPVVEGVGVNIGNATPNVIYSGYFIIRNLGGQYRKLKVTPSAAWIKVASLRPLTAESQLPLRVEIEMSVDQWANTYQEVLTVSLDETSTTAAVVLQTRPIPRQSAEPAHPGTGGNDDHAERRERAVSPASPPTTRGRSPFGKTMNQRPDRFVYTQLGKFIGAASSGIVALVATVWVAGQGAEALSTWPTLGVTFGILSGVYMGFIVIPVAVVVGFGLGWLAGFGVWSIRKL